MPTTPENVLEPYARYVAQNAMLYLNGDGSWSVGPTTRSLVPVTVQGMGPVGDATFGWSAVALEPEAGGWRLYARSDEDEDLTATVKLDAAGHVDMGSLQLLTQAQLYALEERLQVDLNESGGFGAGPVLLQGGSVNLYMDELGRYQIGEDAAHLRTLTLGGQPLDDQLLPAGWEIVEIAPQPNGWNIYAQSPEGAIFEAVFDGSGAYTAGSILSQEAVTALERALGTDIDGNQDVPAPEGWTDTLKTPEIRTTVTTDLSATSGQGSMSYPELVQLFKGLIQTHRTAGNTPLTAQEVTDLQALAARGKAVFAGNGSSADYLTYVMGRLTEGSEANRFFNGGQPQATELGSLAAGSSVDQLERLVQKWLLGGDMPSTVTSGDSATGAAKAASPTYATSTGALFVDGVSLSDVSQGSAGDCYLIAVMAGLAGTKPQSVQAMFVENPVVDGVRSWGVRFFDANGKAHWVTVNDKLPVAEPGGNTLAYAGSASKELNGEIWVPLLEKAYAQANSLGILPRAERTGQNSMAAIEGGFGDPLGQFLGAGVIVYTDPNAGFGPNPYLTTTVGVDRSDASALAKLAADLAAAVNGGKLVWIGVSTEQKDAFGNQWLVAGHAHYAVDADPANPSNTDVKVYNPWGLQEATNPPGPTSGGYLSPVTLTLAELVGLPGLDFMVAAA